METNGRWDLPAPWLSEETVRLPWPPGELADALEALRRIYPSNISKSIFRTQPALTQLLTDFSLIEQCPLLHFGLDSAIAQPWRYPELLRKLRVDEQFPGARFEVSVMAALTHGRISWSYEPLRSGMGKNPDFEIDIGIRRMLMDAKSARVGTHQHKEKSWYWRLMFGEAPTDPDLIPVELEVSERVANLNDAAKEALGEAVRATAKRLLAGGEYPASESVGGLITVTAHKTPRATLNPVFDMDREASRIVRNLVQEGASQIPSDRLGALLINMGVIGDRDIGKTMNEITRWMLEEGSSERQVEQVFLTMLSLYQHKPVHCVFPCSRHRMPPELIETVNSLVRGFNRNLSLLRGYTDDDLPLLDVTGSWPGVEN